RRGGEASANYRDPQIDAAYMRLDQDLLVAIVATRERERGEQAVERAHVRDDPQPAGAPTGPDDHARVRGTRLARARGRLRIDGRIAGLVEQQVGVDRQAVASEQVAGDELVVAQRLRDLGQKRRAGLRDDHRALVRPDQAQEKI